MTDYYSNLIDLTGIQILSNSKRESRDPISLEADHTTRTQEQRVREERELVEMEQRSPPTRFIPSSLEPESVDKIELVETDEIRVPHEGEDISRILEERELVDTEQRQTQIRFIPSSLEPESVDKIELVETDEIRVPQVRTRARADEIVNVKGYDNHKDRLDATIEENIVIDMKDDEKKLVNREIITDENIEPRAQSLSLIDVIDRIDQDPGDIIISNDFTPETREIDPRHVSDRTKLDEDYINIGSITLTIEEPRAEETSLPRVQHTKKSTIQKKKPQHESRLSRHYIKT